MSVLETSRHEAALAAGPPVPAGPRVDIIGIGVQKAATTWLFQCLTDHPRIRPAADPEFRTKEINFFNWYYERGYKWYHGMFEFGPWKTAEFSVLYFHDRDVPGRLHRYNPDARLLLALRNPIERAFSHHKHEVRKGRLPQELYEFRKALPYNPSYIEQGLYATHLTRWLDFFEPEQIHVVEYGDVAERPGEVMCEVFRFCDVDPEHRPAHLTTTVNRTVAWRSPRLNRALGTLSAAAERLLGGRAVDLARASRVPRWLRRRNVVEMDERYVPPLTQADRGFLREIFAEENARLARLLGRNLSHWT